MNVYCIEQYAYNEDTNTYIDKGVSFGYAIFVLERIRVEQLTKEVQKTMTECLDEMYELGRQSVIQGGYRE